jgi:hypothetical protein
MHGDRRADDALGQFIDVIDVIRDDGRRTLRTNRAVDVAGRFGSVSSEVRTI